jgi:hypothetical protein
MSRIALIALMTVFVGGSVLAAETPVVDKREANQERRIEQGKASGELTNREAARLEHAEDRLEANESKAKADGKVTKAERARLRTEARRNSKRIAKQKHDAQDKN